MTFMVEETLINEIRSAVLAFKVGVMSCMCFGLTGADDGPGRFQTLAQTALAAAQNQELKNLITKAGPVIQAHLAKAQDVQAKLSSASKTATPAAAESAKKKKG